MEAKTTCHSGCGCSCGHNKGEEHPNVVLPILSFILLIVGLILDHRTRLVLADSKTRLVSGCFPPSRTACHTGSLSRGFAKRLLHRVYIDVGRFDRSFQHRRISGGCSCHAFLYGWRNAAKQGCRTCFTKYQPSA